MVLTYISILFQLVAGILPLIFLFKKQFHYSLVIYLTFSIISTLVLIVTSYFKINNLLFHNFYILISFISLLVYFVNFRLKYLNIFLIISSLVFLSNFVIEIFQKGFVQNGIQILNISYSVWSLIFFIYLIEGSNLYRLRYDKKVYSIINASILVYNCSAFFLYFKLFTLIKQDSWFIHNYIEGSSKLLIAYAFWKLPKTSHY